MRAHNYAHVNVSAADKIFASATENGVIYFFGEPNVLTQFVSGYGVIIPIWTKNPCCPIVKTVAHAYKGEGGTCKGERRGGFPYRKFRGEG